MDLPYKKVETFDLNGKIFTSETAAIQAAVEAVVGNTGIAMAVLKECCALAPLLARACELRLATAAESESSQG
jgi:hypothetical protein